MHLCLISRRTNKVSASLKRFAGKEQMLVMLSQLFLSFFLFFLVIVNQTHFHVKAGI